MSYLYVGTGTESYRIHPDGRVDVVSHETGMRWSITRADVPPDAEELTPELVNDVDW